MLKLLTPLLCIQLYLNTTFCLFIIYPKTWHSESYAKVSLFVLLQHVCIFIGYWIGLRKLRPRIDLQPKYLQLGKVLCFASILINLVLAPFLYNDLTGGNASLVQGLTSVGEAYRARQMYIREELEVNPIIQVRTILYVFTLFMVPVGVVLWRKSGKLFKGFFLAGVLSQVAVWGASGTMKGIGDVVIFCLGGLLLSKHVKPTTSGSAVAQRHPSKLRLYFVAGVALLTAFLLFSWMQADRLEAYGKYGEYADILFPSKATGSVAEKMVVGAYIASSYATHGYEGLCGCLELPFVWTRGLGSSVAVNGYWEQYVSPGGGLLHENYLFRNELQTGYPALSTWSTVYPWLASDLSFAGVTILMLLIGTFTAKVWIDCLETLSPFAILVFAELLIFFAFVPCNNQLVQSRAPFWGFVGAVILYVCDLIRRKKPRIKPRTRIGNQKPKMLGKEAPATSS